MPNQNTWRVKLKEERAALQAAYIAKPNPNKLLYRHAKLVDGVVIALAKQAALPASVAVLAVGGYGRAKLFPASDVDVLIAIPEQATPAATTLAEQAIEKFVSLLWDSGIEAGTSVRTIAQCLAESAKDVTVLTSLIEARPLCGNTDLATALMTAIWASLDVPQFFRLKIEEQQQRHAKHQDVAMNLEPNIKESPGGLRDLHTVLWLSKVARLGDTWDALAEQGILTAAEAKHLRHHERVLHDIRIRLHFLANRREDRLVFDYQDPLAQMLHLSATKNKRASEALMQRYYLTAKAIWQLNTILLQNLSQKIMLPGQRKIKKLNANYALVDGHLAVLDETIFARDPVEIFRAFLLLQKHPEIPFFAPETLRALWRAAPKINKAVRDNPLTHEIFLEMLRSERLTFVLRRMSRYSVLGRYLPAFGRITGQMQHDLFHVYTVDEHILMVVRNLRRFVLPRFVEQHRLCSELMQNFEHIEVLYLAALFHDIAKGRGGDHSELGTADATRFCKKIGLNQADTELVAWLVAMHLQMSATAQKQDLSDPEVIAQFSARVENERRLTALYLLTVADIRGTSPHVWNSWKAQLLEELFLSTRRTLRQAASGEATNNAVLVEAKRTAALKIFTATEHETELFVALSALTPLWKNFEDRYFQRFEVSEMAWHAASLWQHTDTEKAIVKARASTISDGVQVLVYTPDQGGLFARITAYFERLQLDIVAAKIVSTKHGYALDTFQISPKITLVKNASSAKVSAITINPEALAGLVEQIERELTRELRSDATPVVMKHRVSRQIRHTAFAPEVTIRVLSTSNNDAVEGNKESLLEIALSCADQPGLLSRVARFFIANKIDLVEARIATLGARAEDIFIVRHADTVTSPTQANALQTALAAVLVA
jgi:[protein-PII] uridylyltransferase